MASALEQLREAIVERLQSLDGFAGVKVLSRKVGNLQNQIEEELGKLAIVVIVETAQAGIDTRQSTRVVLDPVAITVTIVEDPMLNQTGKTSTELAELTARALKFWEPSFEGAHHLNPEDPGLQLFPVARGDEDRGEDLVGWTAFFSTRISLEPLAS